MNWFTSFNEAVPQANSWVVGVVPYLPSYWSKWVLPVIGSAAAMGFGLVLMWVAWYWFRDWVS